MLESGVVVARVGQDDGAFAVATIEGREHQVEFPLGAAAIGRAVGSGDAWPKWRAQPRPKDEHGHVDRLLLQQEVDAFLKRSGRR